MVFEDTERGLRSKEGVKAEVQHSGKGEEGKHRVKMGMR